MSFNVSLLKAVAVLLTFDVLLDHVLTLEALLLPIEFKVDITSNSRDWKLGASQFHNFTLDVNILYSFEFWILFKVFCDDFISQLSQTLDFI